MSLLDAKLLWQGKKRGRLMNDMTRKGFFGCLMGLIGVGKAQIPTLNDRMYEDPKFVEEDVLIKPKNGQCPVCVHQAKPWFRQWVSGEIKNCKDTGKRTTQCKPGVDKLETETVRLIRCKACNAAFWQDAENMGEK